MVDFLDLSNLAASTMQASNPAPAAGQNVTFTILLQNPGLVLDTVSITNALPSGLSFAGNLTASSGSANESGGVISWQGAVTSAVPVTIQFDVLVSAAISSPQAIVNTALIDDGDGNVIQREATIIVNGLRSFLPVVAKGQ